MSFFRSIRQIHILIRILFLPSAVIIVCAALHMAGGVDYFIQFIKDWKLALIIAMWIMIAHTALELKTAIEDYIPIPNNRHFAIRGVIVVGCILSLIIGLTIGYI